MHSPAAAIATEVQNVALTPKLPSLMPFVLKAFPCPRVQTTPGLLSATVLCFLVMS